MAAKEFLRSNRTAPFLVRALMPSKLRLLPGILLAHNGRAWQRPDRLHRKGFLMKIALSALTALAFTLPATSQQPSAAPPTGGGPAVSTPFASGSDKGVHPISLDVVVTDHTGQPVGGLAPGDFKLLDNKEPQTITAVRAASGTAAKPEPPVQAILVLDAVNANFTTVSSERQWVAKFLKSNGGELPIPFSFAVLTDQQSPVISSPTRDGNALMSQLDNSPNGLREMRRSEGYWGAVDRNRLSLDALEHLAVESSKTPGRKLVIWISPGWRAFSRDSWLLSEKDEEGLYGAIAQLSTVLRLARVTLYSLDPLGASHPEFYYENFLKGANSPHHVDYGDLMLEVIATQSGGMAVSGDNDLSDLIARCVADARNYYILTYTPPKPDRPNEYHAIQVQVDKPGLKARTRTIYYAQP